MKNKDKTKEQLISELAELHKRLAQLKTSETERKRAEQALKQSEDKFSKAFANSPEAFIISTAKDGRFIEVNDSFTRFTGYTREEVIGKNALEIDIWARAEDRNKLIKMLEKKGRVNNEEFDFRKKSGETVTALYSTEMVEIDNEPSLLSIASDITGRKQSEETLKEVRDR